MKPRQFFIALLVTCTFGVMVAEAALRGGSSQGTGTYTTPSGNTANPLGDTDGDGDPDGIDTDDDNDGVLDTADAFPLDATESLDTDGDAVGNNADTDDDADGILDTDDAFPLDGTQSIAALDSTTFSTACNENLCVVSGTASAGTTSITVTGSHASASDVTQTASVSGGGTFSVTFSSLASGDWTFSVEASNSSSHTQVASAPIGNSASLAEAIVDAISDPANPVTSTDIQNSGLTDAVKTDLTSNSTCGTSGTENCLTWFNSLTASTSCTALTGSSTNSEIESYVNCVMREGHTSVATSYATSNPPSALSTTSQNACQATITGPSPAHCAHPQWTCEVVGTSTPAGWTINNSDVGELTGASLGGTPTNASYTVRASLNIYTPAYTYDYTFSNVRIPAGTETTVTAYHTQSSGSVAGTWNTCISNGGRMATESEVLSHLGWSTTAYGGYSGSIFSFYAPGGSYSPYSNPVVAQPGYSRTNAGSCSGSWSTSDSPFVKSNGRISLSTGSGTKLKYEDSNGDVVNSGCRASSSGTYNFWCRQPNYSCN